MRALIDWYERRWHVPRTKRYNAKHRYAVHHGAGAVTTKRPDEKMAA